MSKPRFAELGRLGSGPGLRRATGDSAAPPIDPEDENEPDDEIEPGKEKDTDMTTPNTESNDYKAGLQAGEEAGRKAGVTSERARFAAVMASDHFVGREALAASLLASDLTSDQIVASLEKAPKPEAKGSADEDSEDRQLMRERLQGNNANLGTDDEDQQCAEAKAKANNYGWAEIHEEIRAARA